MEDSVKMDLRDMDGRVWAGFITHGIENSCRLL
jgi:hypothetical protein